LEEKGRKKEGVCVSPLECRWPSSGLHGVRDSVVYASAAVDVHLCTGSGGVAAAEKLYRGVGYLE
jgi:hypothetical protein